jgi:uncharacterized membrane protein
MSTQSHKREGFVLIVTCIALTVLLGVAGLVVDVGRMYVVKSELQAFADAASLSAALDLDGTQAGIRRAGDAAAAIASGDNAMKWDMGSKAITGYKLEFARGENTPDAKSWEPSPADASGRRFVKVAVTVQVPLTLLRVVESIQADSSTVAVTSVAGSFRGSANAARLVE